MAEALNLDGLRSVAAPLLGVRVLDVSRYVVGAGATRRLADLGADVVKLEIGADGDRLRTLAPTVAGTGLWHEVENLNKKSVAVDLATTDGLAIARRLLSRADVVVESGGRDVLRSKGLDLERLREERPDVVVCSITAFGSVGAWSTLPAHALNIDAMAGLVRTSSSGGRVAPVEVIYGGTGNSAASSDAATDICAALVRVRSGGHGAWLEVSCWDSAIYANRVAVAHQLRAGRDLWDEHAGEINASRHSLYRTSDGGLVYFAPIEDHFWVRFCEGIGRADLLEVGREMPTDFGSPELLPALERIFAGRTTEDWRVTLQSLEIPASPLLELGEALASGHAVTRGVTFEDRHVLHPVTWGPDHQRPGSPPSPAPDLGKHNKEVQGIWGL